MARLMAKTDTSLYTGFGTKSQGNSQNKGLIIFSLKQNPFKRTTILKRLSPASFYPPSLLILLSKIISGSQTSFSIFEIRLGGRWIKC